VRLRLEAAVARFPGLAADELSRWVERRWVCAERDAEGVWFAEVDLARIALIVDLRITCEVTEDLLPLVLSLLDQLYAERRRLAAVLGVLAEQPGTVQDAVRAALAKAG
jgi:chaperone modulatory protein CbpM